MMISETEYDELVFGDFTFDAESTTVEMQFANEAIEQNFMDFGLTNIDEIVKETTDDIPEDLLRKRFEERYSDTFHAREMIVDYENGERSYSDLETFCEKTDCKDAHTVLKSFLLSLKNCPVCRSETFYRNDIDRVYCPICEHEI